MYVTPQARLLPTLAAPVPQTCILPSATFIHISHIEHMMHPSLRSLLFTDKPHAQESRRIHKHSHITGECA
jgi:hypothetical protein